jgi:hypothetical protein
MVTCAFVAGTLYEAHDWLRFFVLCAVAGILWGLRGEFEVKEPRRELER